VTRVLEFKDRLTGKNAGTAKSNNQGA
jgi:hypothetical protein